jgi:excisionase family DNA binding protein
MTRAAADAPYRHPPAPEPTAPPRLALRPQEAANSLGISLRSLMAMVASGEIPHTRIGERCLRFPVEGLRAWIAKKTAWPTEMVPTGPEQSLESSRVPTGGSGRAADCAARTATGPAAGNGNGEARE